MKIHILSSSTWVIGVFSKGMYILSMKTPLDKKSTENNYSRCF